MNKSFNEWVKEFENYITGTRAQYDFPALMGDWAEERTRMLEELKKQENLLSQIVLTVPALHGELSRLREVIQQAETK